MPPKQAKPSFVLQPERQVRSGDHSTAYHQLPSPPVSHLPIRGEIETDMARQSVDADATILNLTERKRQSETRIVT
jgi:hypothetical protein